MSNPNSRFPILVVFPMSMFTFFQSSGYVASPLNPFSLHSTREQILFPLRPKHFHPRPSYCPLTYPCYSLSPHFPVATRSSGHVTLLLQALLRLFSITLFFLLCTCLPQLLLPPWGQHSGHHVPKTWQALHLTLHLPGKLCPRYPQPSESITKAFHTP